MSTGTRGRRSSRVCEAAEPFHEGRIVEEGGLDLGVEEDVTSLLDGDELQPMLARNVDVDGVLLQCDRGRVGRPLDCYQHESHHHANSCAT